MRKQTPKRAAALAFLALGGASGGLAQAPEIPAEAQQRLDHHVGEWSVRSEFLGRNGNVTRSAEATDTARYVIPGRVVQMSTTAGGKTASQAWMFYDTANSQFTLTSVDARGDHWKLTGGLDEYVLTSEPRPHPRGGTLMIRFTHTNIKEDSFEALMEMSRDGGKTWFQRMRQFLTRRE